MKLLISILILTATLAQAANTFERCWLSPIDDLATVTFTEKNIRPLHPMGENELLRARTIQRPTEITGTYVDEMDGTTNNIYMAIPDKYLLWDGTALVGMTTEQRATRDAYDAQAIIDAEIARQAAKSIELKMAENNFLITVIGVNSALGIEIIATDGFAEIQAKIDASTNATIDKLESSMQLNNAWDFALFYGAEWGDVEFHSEVAP